MSLPAILLLLNNATDTLQEAVTCQALIPGDKATQFTHTLQAPGEARRAHSHRKEPCKVSPAGRECLRTPQGHPHTRL